MTVCLNRVDYVNKMENILSDTSTYTVISTINRLKNLQKRVYNILLDLNKRKCLYKDFHKNSLTQTNTVLARCYKLPKVHEPNWPLRPVISLIKSPTYFLSKILYHELKQAIPKPRYVIHNSFVLLSKLKNLTLPENYVLISLDVSSLFTNIPYFYSEREFRQIRYVNTY